MSQIIIYFLLVKFALYFEIYLWIYTEPTETFFVLIWFLSKRTANFSAITLSSSFIFTCVLLMYYFLWCNFCGIIAAYSLSKSCLKFFLSVSSIIEVKDAFDKPKKFWVKAAACNCFANLFYYSPGLFSHVGRFLYRDTIQRFFLFVSNLRTFHF